MKVRGSIDLDDVIVSSKFREASRMCGAGDLMAHRPSAHTCRLVFYRGCQSKLSRKPGE